MYEPSTTLRFIRIGTYPERRDIASPIGAGAAR